MFTFEYHFNFTNNLWQKFETRILIFDFNFITGNWNVQEEQRKLRILNTRGWSGTWKLGFDVASEGNYWPVRWPDPRFYSGTRLSLRLLAVRVEAWLWPDKLTCHSAPPLVVREIIDLTCASTQWHTLSLSRKQLEWQLGFDLASSSVSGAWRWLLTWPALLLSNTPFTALLAVGVEAWLWPGKLKCVRLSGATGGKGDYGPDPRFYSATSLP